MKKIYNKNKLAFTLIELLVVIAIIGILTALAVVSLQNSRRSARDAKRISDVKQIQIALELYYQDNSIYPTTLLPGETLSSNTITYMEQIPYPPTNLDGDCSTTSYIYSTSNDNSYYTINFCISNNVGSFPAGEVVASPRGIGEWSCGDSFKDTRDNQVYNTVQIGEQCWMSENLNVGTFVNTSTGQQTGSTIEKYCYNNNSNNCNIYGGLYEWDEAMNYVATEGAQGICPDGWHIPKKDEFKTLEMYLGMTLTEANNTGWRGTTEGSKLAGNASLWANGLLENNLDFGYSGFNALPAGFFKSSGAFYGLSYYAYFWSSLESGGSAWYRRLGYGEARVTSGADSKADGFSVRCLKTD